MDPIRPVDRDPIPPVQRIERRSKDEDEADRERRRRRRRSQARQLPEPLGPLDLGDDDDDGRPHVDVLV